MSEHYSALALAMPLLAFCAVTVGALLLLSPRESAVQLRLRVAIEKPRRGPRGSFVDRVVRPFGRSLVGTFGKVAPRLAEDEIRVKLAQAGHPAGLDVGRFFAIRTILALGAPALALCLIVATNRLSVPTEVFTIALAGLGWQLPSLWLSRQIDARQKKIQRSLADALDLIVVSVEAGNGLEGALQIVATKLAGPLSEEIADTLSEINLGKPRREALRSLAQRSGASDLQVFVAAVVQADQLGGSITQVLRVQADAMRLRRRQRAEEQAAKVPVKMLIPLVVCIFPALMIVIMGPVVLRIMSFLSQGAMP
jgi:tight adherence protein C